LAILEEINTFSRRKVGRFDLIVISRFSPSALADPSTSLEAIQKRHIELWNLSDSNRNYIFVCFLGLCYVFFNKSFEISWGPLNLTGLGSVLDVLLVAVSFLLSVRVVIRFQTEYVAALGRRMIKHRYEIELWQIKFEEFFERPEFTFNEYRRAFFFHIGEPNPKRSYSDRPVFFGIFLFFIVYMSAVYFGLMTVLFDDQRDIFSKIIIALVVIYSHVHFLSLPRSDNWNSSVTTIDPAVKMHLLTYLEAHGEEKTRKRMQELANGLLLPSVEGAVRIA
jgi:hypothetical protein